MSPDIQQCPTCGAVNQPAGVACRECAEELECRRLRERLFGTPIRLEPLSD